MSIYIINKIRSFVYSLDYTTDVISLQNQFAGQPRTHLGNTVSDILNSLNSGHHYTFNDLHKSVQKLDESNFKIKKIWNRFHQAVIGQNVASIENAYRHLKSDFPRDNRLGIFFDTDLILFENDFMGDLPINGIKKNDFEAMANTYFSFLQKLKFLNPFPPDIKKNLLWNQVLREIRILMSRPLGRRLIEDLNYYIEQATLQGNDPSQITFFLGEHFAITYDNWEIEFSSAPKYDYSLIHGNEARSIFKPPFFNLAHELIHLMHLFLSERSHKDDPDLDSGIFTDPEEFRTIYGLCECHDQTDLCENGIRREFDWPARFSHHRGISPKDTLETRFEFAALTGADGDLIDLIDQIDFGFLCAVVEQVCNNNPKYRISIELFAEILQDSQIPERLALAEKLINESRQRDLRAMDE